MSEADLRLDGNAAGGLLRELFAVDVTAAKATCATCGRTDVIAAAQLYAHAPGAVLRCPHCSEVLMRLVRAHDHLLVDFGGLSRLETSDIAPG
jgi:DNA-directed RNA polymerase subunit RPC12/RpoP